MPRNTDMNRRLGVDIHRHADVRATASGTASANASVQDSTSSWSVIHMPRAMSGPDCTMRERKSFITWPRQVRFA